jgi:hypothetical protein
MKMGSGKMKAALQCIEWRKKGRSCFHELRESNGVSPDAAAKATAEEAPG